MLITRRDKNDGTIVKGENGNKCVTLSGMTINSVAISVRVDTAILLLLTMLKIKAGSWSVMYSKYVCIFR